MERKGYGNALMRGIASARGKYVIMGDSDDSYDFTNLGPFVEKLRAGYHLVMGNRFLGGIQPGAMPNLAPLPGKSGPHCNRQTVLQESFRRFSLWLARFRSRSDAWAGFTDHRDGVRE